MPTDDSSDNENKADMQNYPSNSHTSKEEPKEPERKVRVEKVVTTEVIKRKQPMGKRIAETFAGDDMKSVGSYVLFEVMLPAAKDMIFDAFKEGLARTLYGSDSRKRVSPGSSPVGYNKMYGGGSSSGPKYSGGTLSGGGRNLSPKARAAHEFTEIILPNRGEAEVVLDTLNDVINNYTEATVADLYDALGVTPAFTDNQWGWTNLRDAGVTRVREGWLLNLPKPQPIE